MQRLNKILKNIIKVIGWAIIVIVLLVLLVVLLPVISVILIITGPPAIVESLKKKWWTKQFLRNYQGKTILFCTGGKFYYKFVARNRVELNTMVDEVIYMDPYTNPNYKLINWESIVNLQGGFPILLTVEDKLKYLNLKKEFFQHGKKAADDYFIRVLNNHINELKANKTVL